MPHFIIPKLIRLFFCICGILLLILGPASAAQASFVQPFSLADVDLDESSDFFQGEALNHEYLLILDVDNLLYNFRVTANITDPPGQSYGGWEGSNVEVRGQFIGHYLSALAFAYKSTANAKFKQHADELIFGLSECQASFGDGYLSAFPKEHFDRLEALQPVWAPFYVIHKIMQGLLDQHQLTAQPDAFEILSSMADYFCTWSERVVNDHGIDHWHQVLENEFGGMNDVLYKLSIEQEKQAGDGKNKNKNFRAGGSGGGARWARCAALFDKPAWFDPLVQNQDFLSGLHANTHLAQVNGFAARYEATGDETAAAAVLNFFNIVLQRHSYSTGGSNWFEHWGDGKALGDAIDNPDAAANTQESCTTYNILKIARSLFTWTARAEFADFYERAIVNGVLGIQRTTSSGAVSSGHRHHHHHHHDHLSSLPNAQLEPKVVSLTSADRAKIAATHAMHAVHPRPADYRVVSWPDDPAKDLSLPSPQNTNITTNDEAGQPGQFIYYMPLGHQGGKGENPRAWTHGWGDKFNTFWCCYGSAVESFSKLADSIYFWYTHPEENMYPILFINQFVGSTLRWKLPLSALSSAAASSAAAAAKMAEEQREQRVIVLKQTADLYSSNTATSKVVFSIPPSPSDTSTSSTKNSSTANFYLYWRLPSWLKSEEFQEEEEKEEGNAVKARLAIRINGKFLNTNTLPRVHGTNRNPSTTKHHQKTFSRSSSLFPSSFADFPLLSSFNPPKFGKDTSDYIILGPEWNDGDVLEVDMPMKITTEDLNDSRPEKQNLKAIMMGPFQMAGLTENGDREIDVDPEDIENAVSLPENKDLLYPKGARLLKGKTKQYIIAPIGQLIDKKYTAYFEFASVGPSATIASQ